MRLRNPPLKCGRPEVLDYKDQSKSESLDVTQSLGL